MSIADAGGYFVPTLEMMVAMKFAAMVSPHRPLDRKLMDASDFVATIQRNPDLDRKLLGRLAGMVYGGGQGEVLRMLDDVLAGRKLVF